MLSVFINFSGKPVTVEVALKTIGLALVVLLIYFFIVGRKKSD